MATLPIQVSTSAAALEPKAADLAATATTGDDFPNDGHTLLHVANAHTAPVTLTVRSIPDKTYSLTNAKDYVIGPFSPADFNDNTGKVRFVFDVVTNIFVAAVRAL